MIKVEAVVIRERVETVIDAVEEETGHVGVTVVEAIGHGRQRGVTHEYRGRVFESRFLPKAILTFIVDDDESILSVLRVRLEQDGFEVIVARTGYEGLEAASISLPDLALVDLRLPGMDGFEFSRRLLPLGDPLSDRPGDPLARRVANAGMANGEGAS